jgi:MFS transporter, ACS family, tartrate transporter
VLALSLAYFGTSAGLYTPGMWTPQTIKVFGLTNMQVGFFNAIPPIVAVIAISLVVTFVDRKTSKSLSFSPFRMRPVKMPACQ